MPRPTAPVPPALSLAPFRVTTGFQFGLGRRALRHTQFRSPFRGVRELRPVETPQAHLLDSAVQLAAAYLPLLRSDAGELFSHTTALYLCGAPIAAPTELHVTIPLPLGPARSRNVTGHRMRVEVAATQAKVPGYPMSFPVVPPIVALIQSAPLLSFRELVVAADHLLKLSGRNRSALATKEELTAAAALSNARGIRKLRAALRVARVGAESRMETLQHFELARMGLDTLDLQAEIRDANGRWIGRFDAVDHDKRRILEYDGEQHRTSRAQYLRDEVRLDLARKAGYAIKRTHHEDFRPQSLARTRVVLCEFLGEEPRRVAPDLARYFAEPY